MRAVWITRHGGPEGHDWRKGLKLLRPCGRLVAFGFANLTSGPRRRPAHLAAQVAGIPVLTPLQLMNQNRTVSGVNIGHLCGQIAILREELQAVLTLWDQGKIKPHIDGTYPFTAAAAAPLDPATPEHRQDRAQTLMPAPGKPGSRPGEMGRWSAPACWAQGVSASLDTTGGQVAPPVVQMPDGEQVTQQVAQNRRDSSMPGLAVNCRS